MKLFKSTVLLSPDIYMSGKSLLLNFKEHYYQQQIYSKTSGFHSDGLSFTDNLFLNSLFYQNGRFQIICEFTGI